MSRSCYSSVLLLIMLPLGAAADHMLPALGLMLPQLGADVLGPHASRLAEALLSEMGGRLWDGKQVRDLGRAGGWEGNHMEA